METHETEITITCTVCVEHRNGEISRVLRPVREANGAIRWVDITYALSADEMAELSDEIISEMPRLIPRREIDELVKCIGFSA